MSVAPHIYVITFLPLAACLVLALAAGTWLVDCGVHEAVAKLPGWFRPRTRRTDPPGPAERGLVKGGQGAINVLPPAGPGDSIALASAVLAEVRQCRRCGTRTGLRAETARLHVCIDSGACAYRRELQRRDIIGEATALLCGRVQAACRG